MNNIDIKQSCKYWMGVACKSHVEIAKKGGFCQFCHGKSNPLKRLKAKDWIIYYSPKIEMGGKDLYQKFTAIGEIIDNEYYQVDYNNGFRPFRKNINYINGIDVCVRPLIKELNFIKNKEKWGMFFRYGFFQIDKEDFEKILSLYLI